MELRKTSWYYKLCKVTYGKEFKGFCALCRATFLAAILYVPLMVITLPYQGIHYIFEKKWNKEILPMRAIYAIPSYLIIGWIYCMIAMFWRFDLKLKNDMISILGVYGWVLVIIFLFLYARHEFKFNEKMLSWRAKHGFLAVDDNGSPKPKQPNILIEYIKAVKNKVCPIIEWKE